MAVRRSAIFHRRKAFTVRGSRTRGQRRMLYGSWGNGSKGGEFDIGDRSFHVADLEPDSLPARVIGVAGLKTPWRSLDRWKLPARERQLVKRLEAQLQPLKGPMRAFDSARMRGSNSVH